MLKPSIRCSVARHIKQCKDGVSSNLLQEYYKN